MVRRTRFWWLLLAVLLVAPSFFVLAATAKKSPAPAAAPAPALATPGKESALSALFRSTPEASTTMRLLEALNLIPSEDEDDVDGDGGVVDAAVVCSALLALSRVGLQERMLQVGPNANSVQAHISTVNRRGSR